MPRLLKKLPPLQKQKQQLKPRLQKLRLQKQAKHQKLRDAA